MNRTLFVVLTALLVATGCAAESSNDESTEVAESELSRDILSADGDACTVRIKPDGTKEPGTEKDGECCSNTDSTDCTIIPKPFPKAKAVFMMR